MIQTEGRIGWLVIDQLLERADCPDGLNGWKLGGKNCCVLLFSSPEVGRGIQKSLDRFEFYSLYSSKYASKQGSVQRRENGDGKVK